MKTRLCIGLALLLLASATPVQGQLGAWDLGIEYPGDNEDMPFNVDKGGRSTIQFFVNNDEFQDIEVEFEYDIPFAGEADGPESETISGGSNETFTLSVSGIDVWNYAADSKGEFTITANLVSRAGLPIGLQLIGRPFEERVLFQVAHGYEAVSPSRGHRPAIVNGA